MVAIVAKFRTFDPPRRRLWYQRLSCRVFQVRKWRGSSDDIAVTAHVGLVSKSQSSWRMRMISALQHGPFVLGPVLNQQWRILANSDSS